MLLIDPRRGIPEIARVPLLAFRKWKLRCGLNRIDRRRGAIIPRFVFRDCSRAAARWAHS
jgi:hypothetical protein